MKKQFIYFIAIFFGLLFSLKTQAQYGTGLKKDLESTEKVPLAAPLMRGEYTSLPAAFSLKNFAPTPRNQGNYGTCVGWAVAYASRTILQAQSQNLTDSPQVDELAFSPYFLYEKAKPSNDLDCQEGTTLYRGLEELKNSGVVKFSEFNEICNQNITSQLLSSAKNFKIQEYRRLFETGASEERKIQVIKKAIAEGKPVVVGIECCNTSFLEAKGKDYWYPKAEEGMPYGGHAVAVIAYDDEKYGGSVQIMNSWGTVWGNGGFIWIPYSTFAQYCFEAYEIEIAKPVVTKTLSGGVRLALSAGKDMTMEYKSLGYYQTQEGYHSGTSFRIYLTNQEPAYVYVLGSDLSNTVFTLFPFQENITPYLNYKSNNVAIPDEEHFITLDKNTGTDYICVLYSVKPIDVKNLKTAIELGKGNFSERVYAALGTQLVNPENVLYNQAGGIYFRGQGNEQMVVPIIIGIEHL